MVFILLSLLLLIKLKTNIFFNYYNKLTILKYYCNKFWVINFKKLYLAFIKKLIMSLCIFSDYFDQ